MAEGDLTDLQSRIQAKGYGTDTATAQTAALNSVLKRVCGMRRWPFLEVADNTSITTTAGDETYSLSAITDYLHIDAARALIGTEYYDLEYKRPQELRRLLHQDRVNGIPEYWTQINNILYLYPRPDRVYTLSIDYIKKPSTLSAGGDTNVLPLTYQDVLVWGAIAEMTFRERDIQGYNVAKQEYFARLRDMMTEYGLLNRQNSSTVVESGYWEAYDAESPYSWLTF